MNRIERKGGKVKIFLKQFPARQPFNRGWNFIPRKKKGGEDKLTVHIVRENSRLSGREFSVVRFR